MKIKKAYSFIILSILALLLAANVFAKDKPTPKPSQKIDPVLNIYNWEDYWPSKIYEDFEKRFGVKINLEVFDDEETMISSIQSNPGKYDVAVASDLVVRMLIQSRLLEPIDLRNIPNFRNLDHVFVNLEYDPNNQYSIPYIWGTTGIAYNSQYVTEVNSWNILWDSAYKGKMSMLINPYDVITAGLKSLGYSLSTVKVEELEAAGKKLREQKPLIRGYEDSKTIIEDLVSEELWIAQIYSGDTKRVKSRNSSIQYVIPKEGAYLYLDNVVIPRDAKHKQTAEVFVNYLLEPQTSAELSNYIGYANCNRSALDCCTPKEVVEDRTIYPSEEMLKNCEFYEDMGTPEEIARREQVINKIWTELQFNGQ